MGTMTCLTKAGSFLMTADHPSGHDLVKRTSLDVIFTLLDG